jgi:hypothetical protein
VNVVADGERDVVGQEEAAHCQIQLALGIIASNSQEPVEREKSTHVKSNRQTSAWAVAAATDCGHEAACKSLHVEERELW